MTAKTVLVVEDNADARETLQTLLELEGHVVKAAGSGSQAVEVARSAPLDVALIDIGLPDVDGYEVARQIRGLPHGPGMLLVALTGYGQPEDRLRAQEAGFDAHVVKPVDPDEVVRLVARRG